LAALQAENTGCNACIIAGLDLQSVDIVKALAESSLLNCEEPTGRANARPMTGSSDEAIQSFESSGLLRLRSQ
jgi:hypothetical protein